jgi:hypothetical protein
VDINHLVRTHPGSAFENSWLGLLLAREEDASHAWPARWRSAAGGSDVTVPASNGRDRRWVAGGRSSRLGVMRLPRSSKMRPIRMAGWQQHSVRGFFPGAVRKKLGLTLVSDKIGDERVTGSCHLRLQSRRRESRPAGRPDSHSRIFDWSRRARRRARSDRPDYGLGIRRAPSVAPFFLTGAAAPALPWLAACEKSC